MDKIKGKLYSSVHRELRKGKKYIFTTVILCTGNDKYKNTFSGVVVKQTNDFSLHHVGLYSNSWSNLVFNEYNSSINIDNKNWKDCTIGDCIG